MKQLTDEQWWEIADYSSSPVGLEEADISLDFVYDRTYGFFVVQFGMHTIVMAKLLAFRNGYACYTDMEGRMSDLADKWLEEKGTCFKSSQSDTPMVWKASHLSISETRILGKNGLTELG